MELIARETDLPSHIIQEFQARGNQGRIGGVFDPASRRVWLVAENLDGPDHALAIWRHEQGLHHGIRGLFGIGHGSSGAKAATEELDKFLDGVFRHVGEDGFADLAGRYNFDFSNIHHQRRAAEEFLAGVAEKLDMGKALEPDERKLWDRLLDFVRTLARKLGHDAELTDAEILRVVKDSMRWVFEGEGGGKAGGGDVRFGLAETLKKVGAKTRKAILEVYDHAVRGDNSLKDVRYRTVGLNEAQRIKKATGLDVAGYEHVMDNYAIKHILESHGNELAEAKRGQLPINREHFEAIPETVSNPDNIKWKGKTKRGLDAIAYEKRINGLVIVVEEARRGKKKLALVSMCK